MIVLEVLRQIAIAASIISGSSVLTGLLNAAMNIQNTTVIHKGVFVAEVLGTYSLLGGLERLPRESGCSWLRVRAM